jgi:predicted PurR-regulated permease PerM
LIEFALKLAAPLAAIISMAASGGFIYKVVEGFRSLPDTVREIIWWIRNIPEISNIIDDYNTLTAAEFNQKYGTGAVNYVMDYLNEGVEYLQQVYMNFAERPITTISAALLAFLICYLLARVVRFIRQQGEGSVVTKFERRAGNKIFKKEDYNEKWF